MGAARTDEEWSTALETAQTATRRDDLKHGTNAAYAAGCVCAECREHQRERMAIGSQKPQTGASSGGASGASTRARTTVDTADVYGNMPVFDSRFQDRLLKQLAEVAGIDLEGQYGARRQTV